MKEHVALVGFMGAGKSTVGRRLAKELGMQFVDTDETIVARYGPIPEIFARDGEPAFRARELEAVRDALDGPPCVLALGGGAVTHPPTRSLLAERALRVYLDVPFSVLLGRLRRSKTKRPLLGDAIDPAHVRALHAARRPLYAESEMSVSGSRRSLGAIAREIADLVRAR
ncbi:MAG: shikimate kinase [Candidatus Eremiobacteraeota bacterium]|nr:shikimate kinase [Candidatus Eremiobacteraeota bacterium]